MTLELFPVIPRSKRTAALEVNIASATVDDRSTTSCPEALPYPNSWDGTLKQRGRSPLWSYF